MKRAPEEVPAGLRGWALPAVAAALAPLGCRLALLLGAGRSLTPLDGVGLLSDLAVASGVAALLVFALRRSWTLGLAFYTGMPALSCHSVISGPPPCTTITSPFNVATDSANTANASGSVTIRPPAFTTVNI